MKRSFFLLTAAITMIFAGCEKYDHAIADLEDRLDVLEGAKIPSIEEQIVNINTSINDLKAVDIELAGYIDALEDTAADLQKQLDDNAAADAATKAALEKEISDIKGLIATLQAKDTELDQKIADLKKYVDDEISATENWANQTFSTLEQYQAVQTEIATLKTLIEQNKTEITAAYTKAISDAITASETSMKSWVNETLAAGYYDIATIDAKLSALETKLTDADADLAKQIEDQQAALEQAKKDLTAAHEKAITDAITNNNGLIDDAIAAAVTAAKNDLQNEIDAISSQISAIESRLSALENRIQSLTYIPAYTDGKATVTYDTPTQKSSAVFDFFVSPKSAVANIKAEHLAMKAVYTASTRAVSLIDLPVTAVETDAVNGTITVTVSGENLSTEFFAGTADASAFLIVDDGNNELISAHVQLAAKTITSVAVQLATPTNLKDETVYGTFKASWDAVPNADFYYVYFGYPGDLDYSAWTKVETTSAEESYDTNNIGAGMIKEFYVVAGSDNTDYTTSERATIGLEAPATPAGITITYEAENQVTPATDPFGAGVTYTHTFADGKGTITFDSSITSVTIAQGAFASTEITSLTLSEGVTVISTGAFRGCASLTSVEIPASVSAIGPNAFYSCSSLVIVKYYGLNEPTGASSAFRGCSSLLYVLVPAGYTSSFFAGVVTRNF